MEKFFGLVISQVKTAQIESIEGQKFSLRFPDCVARLSALAF
jgi:hypothetical protein